VKVDEPDEAEALEILRGVASVQEKHHKVLLLDEAMEAAVKLSRRYIPARQLPDKAVSLLDTACARVATSQHGTPGPVEDVSRRIMSLETELEIVNREATVGLDRATRAVELSSAIATEREKLAELETRWKTEKGLVESIVGLRQQLRDEAAAASNGSASGNGSTATSDNGDHAAPSGGAATATQAAPAAVQPGLSREESRAILAELSAAQARLAELQGENPLILPAVDAQAVAAVVSDWTGVPVGRMVKNEIQAVLKLADTLERRVIGQRHGLEAVAKRIQTSRAGLENPTRPIGVFLLAGPSGVGKTETALTLAEALYGGEQNVITINMSEFQESHTVSTLKGSPPGYVGYGEGGILTEAVRRRPYSVVLLDEVEKAHSDVHELFFQVFDKGRMEDGQGRMIDFKNTIILLTSNVGSDLIMNLCKDPDLMPSPEGIAKSLRDPLLKVFPAALLGRLVVIPYYPISDAMLRGIIKLQLDRVVKRVRQSQGVGLTYDDSVVDLIASRCTESQSGARAVDAIITHTMLPAISLQFLNRMAEGSPPQDVRVGVKDSEFEYVFAD
jgi:type VI secretion system protein VasG